MKRNYSINTQRIQPYSQFPQNDYHPREGIISHFYDSFDQLIHSHEISTNELEKINTSRPESSIQSNFQTLQNRSQLLLRLASQKKGSLNNSESSGPYSTEQLADFLTDCASRWHKFRHQLNDNTDT